jgi:prefoldin alpha subunit
MAESAPTNKEAEEAVAQLRYLQNIYSQQYEFLENEIATYSLALNSMRRNSELIENTSRLSNSKILVNGEAGMYFEAGVGIMEKVIAYVGAGYLVEKSLEEAKEFAKSNERRSEEGLRKLISDKQKVEKELMDISYKLSSVRQR